MRILVLPHAMELGGSQLNAIQLAAGVADLGHEVIVCVRPGPLVAVVESYGLGSVVVPEPGRRPSIAVVRHLRRLIVELEIDIVHGYEWPPILEACLAARRLRCRPVGTVMSMAIASFIPRSVPLVVGTEQLAASERLTGRDQVHVIEPPVDLGLEAAVTSSAVTQFRARWGLREDDLIIGMITRLAAELKLEGVLAAIDAVGHLQPGRPHLRLLIVGDGPCRPEVEAAAGRVNAATGRSTVVLTGGLDDPRPAYAVSDIVLGMGGSVLRGMAAQKPVVIQGEQGFWERLVPSRIDRFLWTGWYGSGAGVADGERALRDRLAPLVDDPVLRREGGHYAGEVVHRFDLVTASQRQVAVYEHAAPGSPARPSDPAPWEMMRAGMGWCVYQLRKRWRRRHGSASRDDFNAAPLARSFEPSAVAEVGSAAIVWFAGVGWDAMPGTDKQLVRELVRRTPVVWVDPPSSWLRERRTAPIPRVTPLGANLVRVHTTTMPGVTRPGLRTLAQWLARRQGFSIAEAWGRGCGAVLVSTPEQVLPKRAAPGVALLYYETDDFVAGSALFGVSEHRLRRLRWRNVRRATHVLAVTEELTQRVAGAKPSTTLPNGCRLPSSPASLSAARKDERQGRQQVGLVGQLNDRLDLAVLEAVVRAGIPLLVVGPVGRLTAVNAERLERILAADVVEWVGYQPAEALDAYLARMRVGLTPYVDNEFNRASFPLKTLEYLASGLEVVSTDLPAVRELGTHHVRTARSPEEFVYLTRRALEASGDSDAMEQRREFAELHSWARRAERLHAIYLGHDVRPAARAPEDVPRQVDASGGRVR